MTVLGGACGALRFAEGVRCRMRLATRFVEVGPGGGPTASSSRQPLGEALSVAMMRREQPEVSSVPSPAPFVHRGAPKMDWPAVFGVRADGSNCRPMLSAAAVLAPTSVWQTSAVLVCWQPGMVCWVRL